MNKEIDLKIATLNLNGETFWSINRRPRLPQDLFNIEKIKKALVDKIIIGLNNILNNGTYDIIAIQELVYISDYYNDIKDVIEENGYQLIIPENLGKNTHFTVGFIFKDDEDEDEDEDIVIENIPIENNVLLNEIPMNKIICYKYTKNGTSYEILNVHLTINILKT